jgi:hypothetical protein
MKHQKCEEILKLDAHKMYFKAVHEQKLTFIQFSDFIEKEINKLVAIDKYKKHLAKKEKRDKERLGYTVSNVDKNYVVFQGYF